MNQIINYVSDFFGIIMRWCYVFVNNYGLSIIVFTIFTKFVLFPISLITQKNSIKMAQMRPELDALKVKYVDDKDRYADAQLELYKNAISSITGYDTTADPDSDRSWIGGCYVLPAFIYPADAGSRYRYAAKMV